MDQIVQYTTQQRIRIVEAYFATKSVVLTQRQYRRHFVRTKVPDRRTIIRLVAKFRETGSVANANKGHSGRPRSVKTPNNIQNLRDRLEKSPRKSTRRLSQEVGISRSSVLRILHDDLKLFPYKIQLLQSQTDRNKAERLAFCQDISQRIENDPGLLDLIFFSDEAHCHLSGHINKQNMRFWAKAQPHEHSHRPLSQEKVTVWCAIGRNGIIGPYFFEDENENRVTVNTDRYIALMRSKFIPALRRKRGVDMNTVIYQQDGAPHCSNRSLEFLRRYFPGDRLISRRTDFPWPPYSPDLNPPDYFLWGYLKERIYDNNPQTLAALKGNIRREIRRIPADMIGRVIENFNVRVGAVIGQRGAWIEHIINY